MPNKLTIIFDRITGDLSTFYGGRYPAPMQPGGAVEVFQGDRLLVNLRVVETLTPGAAQTAVDLTDPATPTALRVGVRASRSESATLYAQVNDYNEGYDATNENLSTGRITWALPFDTAALDSALASASADHVVGHADFSELRSILGTQFPTTFFGLTIKIYKQVDGGDVETHSGTAQAGASANITLAADASAVDDTYNGFYILITGGTGAGQERAISDYNGTTKVATILTSWTTNPNATSTYQIRASRNSTTVLTDAEVVQRTPEVQTFSGNGTLVAANGVGVVYVSGSPTLTLPSASDYTRMGYIIINTDGGTTTINRAGTDTINSAATSFSVVGDYPAYIMRDTSSHWQARHAATTFLQASDIDTLAELNAIVGDATLDDSGDPRDPNTHAASHQNGGSDEIATATPGANAIPKAGAGGELAAGWLPDMVGDSGSGGTKGAAPAPGAGDAAASKFLKADGTWATPAGAGDVTAAASLTDNAIVRGDGGAKGVQTTGIIITDVGQVRWLKATDEASATTTDLSALEGNFAHITGTTTITGLGTVAAGAIVAITFDGILTFTHNGTSLILPTGANITTAAGDTAIMVSEGSGNWKCLVYQRADGTSLAGSAGDSRWSTIDSGDYTATPADTNTLTMSDTSAVDGREGCPVRYTISSVVYYGIIVSVSANTSMDIVGDSLSGDVTLLEIGVPELAVLIPLPTISGTYGDATSTDLLASKLFRNPLIWDGPSVRILGYHHEHAQDDGEGQPRINVEVGGTNVSSANTSAGVDPSTTRANTGVAINTPLQLDYGDTIELEVNTAGGDGDALDLDVCLYGVLLN